MVISLIFEDKSALEWRAVSDFLNVAVHAWICMVCGLISNCIVKCELSTSGSLSVPSHPTSCCSAAEIMSVLFFHAMRYKTKDPRNQCNDRFVLSKVELSSGDVILFSPCRDFDLWRLFRATLHLSCMQPGWRQVFWRSLIFSTCASLTATWRATPHLSVQILTQLSCSSCQSK